MSGSSASGIISVSGLSAFELGEVAHALLFHQVAQSGQFLHEPHDDLIEQPLQLPAGGRTRFLEHRFSPGAPIHPVGHQAVQMDVQAGRLESVDLTPIGPLDAPNTLWKT